MNSKGFQAALDESTVLSVFQCVILLQLPIICDINLVEWFLKQILQPVAALQFIPILCCMQHSIFLETETQDEWNIFPRMSQQWWYQFFSPYCSQSREILGKGCLSQCDHSSETQLLCFFFGYFNDFCVECFWFEQANPSSEHQTGLSSQNSPDHLFLSQANVVFQTFHQCSSCYSKKIRGWLFGKITLYMYLADM